MIDIATLAAAAPATFDVEAATRAYLDTLQGAARAKVRRLFRGRLLADPVGHPAERRDWLAMLRFGWSARWRDWAERVTKRRWLQPALYALPYVVASALLALPWSLYTGYFREKQYDLMNLSLGGWLTEQAMSLVISILATAIFFAILFAVIRRAPRIWWLGGPARSRHCSRSPS
jgi:STE24 endopeptidase